jgi:hypothetical protein
VTKETTADVNSLAERFTRHRKKLGSQEWAAAKLGKSHGIVQGYENGTRPIPLSALLALGMADLLQELADEMRGEEPGLCPEQLAPAVQAVSEVGSRTVVKLVAANADNHVCLREGIDLHDTFAEMEAIGRRGRIGAARLVRERSNGGPGLAKTAGSVAQAKAAR